MNNSMSHKFSGLLSISALYEYFYVYNMNNLRSHEFSELLSISYIDR